MPLSYEHARVREIVFVCDLRMFAKRCVPFVLQVPYFLHFEPSLDAFNLRSDVISSLKMIAPPFAGLRSGLEAQGSGSGFTLVPHS